MDIVEKAAFVVALDDVPYEYDKVNSKSKTKANSKTIILQNDPSKLDNFGKVLLHGNGYNRWFDKSFTLCIGSNGGVSYFNRNFLVLLKLICFRLDLMRNILGKLFKTKKYINKEVFLSRDATK